MRSGFIVAMCAFGVNALKVSQDAPADAGSDLSAINNGATATASEPAPADQGTDLSAMLANIAPTLTVNVQEEAPKVNASSPESAAPQVAESEPEQISTALFDLNADELATLMAMEDQLYQEVELDDLGSIINTDLKEIAAVEQAEEALDALETGSLDADVIAQWEQEMLAIEQQLITQTADIESEMGVTTLEEAIADEVEDEFADIDDEFDDLDAELAAEDAINGKEVQDVTPALAGMKVFCSSTSEAYKAQISETQAVLDQSKALSDSMAQALSDIDPNMDNASEGKAFIRKMYKLRNKGIQSSILHFFPETPEPCVEMVAGKVIQIEDLDEQLDQANSFKGFFADVYCSAYINAVVTMKDGLQQIFPGGLDQSISNEIQRLYGPLEKGTPELDSIEIASVEAFMDALDTGLWSIDESTLIQVGEPLADAFALCDGNVTDEVALAKQDRDDYLNDLNFLNYLKSL